MARPFRPSRDAMGKTSRPSGPSAKEADLLKLQQQLMAKQAQLKRALANGKRNGSGVLAAVRSRRRRRRFPNAEPPLF